MRREEFDQIYNEKVKPSIVTSYWRALLRNLELSTQSYSRFIFLNFLWVERTATVKPSKMLKLIF
jgi:hypothetical protein